MASAWAPVVSLPAQYVIVPLGGEFIELGSITLAPLPVLPPLAALVLAPPSPSSLPPQAALARQIAAATPSATRFMRSLLHLTAPVGTTNPRSSSTDLSIQV